MRFLFLLAILAVGAPTSASALERMHICSPTTEFAEIEGTEIELATAGPFILRNATDLKQLVVSNEPLYVSHLSIGEVRNLPVLIKLQDRRSVRGDLVELVAMYDRQSRSFEEISDLSVQNLLSIKFLCTFLINELY